MKNIRYISLLFTCLALVLLCITLFGGINYILEFQRFKNPDTFYSTYDEGFLGDVRFPLIKPYQIIYAAEEHNWILDLISQTDPDSNIFRYSQLRGIEKVSVENNKIMVYTPYIAPYTIKNGEKALHWFVIIPDRKTGIGFESEKDFLAYIKNYDIDKPNWMDTKSAFDQFRKTGCLDWIPGCK